MKILQIITSLNTGGAEKLLIESVPLYQQKGIETDVLILKDNQTHFRTALENNSRGKVITLSKGSVYNPVLIFKIIPYLKQYDVVHVHLFPALYWVVLAKWISFSKTKIVYTEHNTNNKRRNHFILKWIDRIIYKGISKIVTIADEVDGNIKAHLKFREDKFMLIYNGVDIEKYATAKSLNKNTFFSEDDFLLIQVSSFREQKDQPTLVKTLNNLPENIKLLLVGDGHLRKDCEQLVHKLKLQNRVKFLGIRTDIPELLKTADVVVLSSFYEGLSLSSIEGMASKPFVASDVPGLREIVKNHGLLFKQGDSKELANHILKLYEDKEYYDKIAVRCLERAKEFDIQKMVDRYIEVYKKSFNQCNLNSSVSPSLRFL